MKCCDSNVIVHNTVSIFFEIIIITVVSSNYSIAFNHSNVAHN